MVAIVLALASSLAYGLADFAGGLATRKAHVLRVVAIAAPASMAVGLVALPLLSGAWSAEALWWGSASGVASALAFTLLYQSLAVGPMGVLSPITALVSAVLPAAVGILAGEHLTAVALAGIVLALVGVVLISAGTSEHGVRPSPGAIALAVGAGSAIAAQLICLDQSPSDSGVVPLIAGRAVSAAILLGAFAWARHRIHADRPNLWLAAGAGVLDGLANLAFLLAAREGDLAVVAVITALYPASTVVLARFVLGERLARTQVAGLAIGAGAVTMLAAS